MVCDWEAEIQRLREETALKGKINDMLFTAGKAVLECEEFADAARKIFDACCAVTGAKSGYVALLSEDGAENEVLFLEAGGMPCTVDESLPMPIRGLRADAYRTNQVVYENDFMNSKWEKFMPHGHVALRNVMFAPLTIGGKTVGIMGLANKDGDFTPDNAVTSGAFGELAAIALRRSHDLEERKKLEERLRQAEKMEAVGQLAGGIAHDFNNILAGIIGFAEMSLDEVSEGSLLYMNLKQILAASERARRTVGQILTYSRPDHSSQQPIFLTPILEEAVGFMKHILPSSLDIQLHICEETQPILANPVKIHDILMNLATNASHACGGKGKLRFLLGEEKLKKMKKGRIGDIQPGMYSVIQVRDWGCGMNEDILKRIFDPFFTTKDVDQGTGMGLSVVMGEIQGHEGDVLVSSKEGEGTTFEIYLPKTDQKVAKPENIQPELQGGNERILFVDDEKILANMARQMLEKLGYSVNVFSDSHQAWEAFEKSPASYDLVIADQTMPGFTGIELAQKMLTTRPSLPFILCTGYSMTVSEADAQKVGIKAFIMKPYNISKFAHIIRQVLD